MKSTPIIFGAVALTSLAIFATSPAAQAQYFPSSRTEPAFIRVPSAITTTVYFPIVYSSRIDPCAAIPNQTYGTVAISGAPTDRPAEQHADLNLGLRGYTPTNQTKSLVELTGATDPNAPKLAGLFSPLRLPSFTSTWQVGDWNWDTNTRQGWVTDPVVTLLGMGTGTAEIITLPASGYSIGTQPVVTGFQAMVLYATTQRITLKYTREDNVISGYTIHIENICVEPSLLALYNTWNTNGRSRLPAVNSLQPIGRANRGEILVAIRDNGTFLDPRSHKDWWQSY